MLNYQHAAHAGNYADVLKHMLLSICIEQLRQSAIPILYIDTHAGSASYELDNDHTSKNKLKPGIKILDFSSLSGSIAPYRNCVEPFLKHNRYPGSPVIAANLLRTQDQLNLYELHNDEYILLKQVFEKDQRTIVNHSDGYQALQALQPTRNQQLLILIDPPYEQDQDYKKVIEILVQGFKIMPEAHYLIWYPVTRRSMVNKMMHGFQQSGFSNIWRYELGVSEDTDDNKMTASGIVAVNPPPRLNQYMHELLPALQRQLAPFGYYLMDKVLAG